MAIGRSVGRFLDLLSSRDDECGEDPRQGTALMLTRTNLPVKL